MNTVQLQTVTTLRRKRPKRDLLGVVNETVYTVRSNVFLDWKKKNSSVVLTEKWAITRPLIGWRRLRIPCNWNGSKRLRKSLAAPLRPTARRHRRTPTGAVTPRETEKSENSWTAWRWRQNRLKCPTYEKSWKNKNPKKNPLRSAVV